MFRIGPYEIETPFLLAPMAGVSEMPFRVLTFEMGAGLATTELISSKGIFYGNRRTRQYLTYDKDVEKPYSLQLFGGELEPMAEAARVAWEHGAEILDINMGCPVKKVTKTGSGSALMCDPFRAAELLTAMRKATEDKVPITAKIRTGWTAEQLNFVEVARALEDAGCAAIAMHGRSRAQGYSGFANWDLIAELKDAVKMPVIGNGDVRTFDDAHRMMKETACDAVMIGRGALGNPWIFKSLAAGEDLGPPTAAERRALILKHLRAHVDFHVELMGEEERKRKHRRSPEEQAIRTFRPHLIWYSRGIRGGAAFRGDAMTLETYAQVEDAVEAFFGGVSDEADLMGDVEDAEGIDYRQAFG